MKDIVQVLDENMPFLSRQYSQDRFKGYILTKVYNFTCIFQGTGRKKNGNHGNLAIVCYKECKKFMLCKSVN